MTLTGSTFTGYGCTGCCRGTRGPPRGGVRSVTFTKTHVKRSLHTHQRTFYVLRVTLASGVSMTSAQTPGSAPNPRQQRSQSPRSQHASSAGIQRLRNARSLRSSMLLRVRPAAPARQARCLAASSSRLPTRLVDVGSCGTGLARINSDVTACVSCHGTGGGQGWQPHDSGCEGCRDEWCQRCA